MVTQSASEHKKKVVKKRPFKNQGTCDGAFTEERGLLQEDLASATGFCTKTIGRVERGERAPSAEFMLRIAAYFNLLVEDVFKLEEH